MQRHDVSSLISTATRFLHAMQLDDRLFCLERVRGEEAPRGGSLRYSLMAYIGLAKAEANGYEHGFDLDAVQNALWSELGAQELQPGDLGLYQWADAVRPNPNATLPQKEAPDLRVLEGQEVAWLAIGRLLRDGRAEAPVNELLDRRHPGTGLLYHYGARSPRRRFANFATQISGLLALSLAARLEERALPAARALADRLIALQLPDGGWPWLYDVSRGSVVERYEVYSVHQHAMAPMGLLALTEASGEQHYAAAAVRGLEWIHGRNELGLEMVDGDAELIYRSIRRRRPFDRAVLYANTAAALAVGGGAPLAGVQVELNATCRPYELGWLLEAWCGRESVAG